MRILLQQQPIVLNQQEITVDPFLILASVSEDIERLSANNSITLELKAELKHSISMLCEFYSMILEKEDISTSSRDVEIDNLLKRAIIADGEDRLVYARQIGDIAQGYDRDASKRRRSFLKRMVREAWDKEIDEYNSRSIREMEEIQQQEEHPVTVNRELLDVIIKRIEDARADGILTIHDLYESLDLPSDVKHAINNELDWIGYDVLHLPSGRVVVNTKVIDKNQSCGKISR